MPIYDYECPNCGYREEVICISWKNRPKRLLCKECIDEMKQIISRPQDMKPNWEPYWDHNLGDEPVLVKSREHRRRLKKERNLVDQYHHRPGMPGQWV